jgi:hypothetical protein
MKHPSPPLRYLLLIFFFTPTIYACTPQGFELITQVPGLPSTLAAQTIMANTKLKSILYTATPTIQPIINLTSPTNNPQPVATDGLFSNPQASYTPIPSLTPIKNITEGYSEFAMKCNMAEFIKDVTIPDDSVIGPGDTFTKIWELKNTGSCTWTTDYYIVNIWGQSFGIETKIPLTQNVAPGELVNLALELVAPDYPDCYQANWVLQDPMGNQFGTGPKGLQSFWVAISVWAPNMGVPMKTG